MVIETMSEETSESENKETSIQLLAGRREDGEMVFEQVRAKDIGDGCYQLVSSPLFARAAAKGDIIRMQVAGGFEVEQHNGNLCVRVMAKQGIDEIKQRLLAPLNALEAELDFENERALVYSIHVKAGFEKIEAAFTQALQGKDDAIWVYANVYDPVDGETPLNWWHDYLAK